MAEGCRGGGGRSAQERGGGRRRARPLGTHALVYRPLVCPRPPARADAADPAAGRPLRGCRSALGSAAGAVRWGRRGACARAPTAADGGFRARSAPPDPAAARSRPSQTAKWRAGRFRVTGRSRGGTGKQPWPPRGPRFEPRPPPASPRARSPAAWWVLRAFDVPEGAAELGYARRRGEMGGAMRAACGGPTGGHVRPRAQPAPPPPGWPKGWVTHREGLRVAGG